LELPQNEILQCESPAEIPDEQTMRKLALYGMSETGEISLHVDPNDRNTESFDTMDEIPDEMYIDEQYDDLPTIDTNGTHRHEKKKKPHSEMKLHLTTAAELQQQLQQRQQTNQTVTPISPTQPKPRNTNDAETTSEAEKRQSKTTTKSKRPKYKAGMPVRHRDYGNGIVLSVTNGNEKTVTVDFEETVGTLQLPLPCKLLKPLEKGLDEIF
jgi:hypothetical protein